MRNLIQGGELGTIRRVNWIITNWFRTEQYYKSGDWRATWKGEGGGVLLNQCPHNLDLYQWLFGVPTSIRAFCGFGRFHDIEVEDDVTAHLEHENGAKGVFIATTGEMPGTNRLEIAGDRGRVVFEDGRIEFRRTLESVQEFCDNTPLLFPTMPTWKCEIPPAQGGGGQHLEVLRNFVDAILDGTPLIAPAAEGIHSVSMANAMILSAWTGETISLPLDGARYEAELRAHIEASDKVKSVREAEVANLTGTY
jgi:predicted dehydrogenase